MKKILVICFSLLLLIGCNEGGRNVNYKTGKGDIKLTITKEYIIVDTCAFNNGFDQSIWEFEKTISRSDTTACHELLEKLLVK